MRDDWCNMKDESLVIPLERYSSGETVTNEEFAMLKDNELVDRHGNITYVGMELLREIAEENGYGREI